MKLSSECCLGVFTRASVFSLGTQRGHSLYSSYFSPERPALPSLIPFYYITLQYISIKDVLGRHLLNQHLLVYDSLFFRRSLSTSACFTSSVIFMGFLELLRLSFALCGVCVCSPHWQIGPLTKPSNIRYY